MTNRKMGKKGGKTCVRQLGSAKFAEFAGKLEQQTVRSLAATYSISGRVPRRGYMVGHTGYSWSAACHRFGFVGAFFSLWE